MRALSMGGPSMHPNCHIVLMRGCKSDMRVAPNRGGINGPKKVSDTFIILGVNAFRFLMRRQLHFGLSVY
jgi:hypothetical protein